MLTDKTINKRPAGSNVNRSGRGLNWGPVVAERDRKHKKRCQNTVTVHRGKAWSRDAGCKCFVTKI